MAIRSRIQPIDRSVIVQLTSDLSPAARSRTLAFAARAILADTLEENSQVLGYVPGYQTFVDGSEGVPVEAVKPEGVIVYQFQLLFDLFVWIFMQLSSASPVLTGRYKSSHIFFADGAEIDPLGPIPVASEYVFMNDQPYARKIERGLSKQAPDGVYEGVAALAAARYGNIARIIFTYRSMQGGAIGEWARTTKMIHKNRRKQLEGDKRQMWLTRQPAIVITV